MTKYLKYLPYVICIVLGVYAYHLIRQGGDLRDQNKSYKKQLKEQDDIIEEANGLIANYKDSLVVRDTIIAQQQRIKIASQNRERDTRTHEEKDVTVIRSLYKPGLKGLLAEYYDTYRLPTDTTR